MIYKIKIPFEDIYTSAFILTEGKHCMVADSGCSGDDAKKYILPELKARGLVPEYVVLSHLHSDHSGGILEICNAYPKAKLAMFSKTGFEDLNRYFLSDGQVIFGRYRMLNLLGHSDDSLGIYDIKNKVLVSFDSLQMYGISKYGTSFDNYEKYLLSVERVRDILPQRIVASHEYVPLGAVAEGYQQVTQFLDECKNAAVYLCDFSKRYSGLSDDKIAQLYCQQNPHLPNINSANIRAVRNYAE